MNAPEMLENVPDSAATALVEDGVRHLLLAKEVEEGDDGLLHRRGAHLSLHRDIHVYECHSYMWLK